MDTGVDHAAVGWEQVRRLTFVPFLADGRCALVPAGDRLVLPSGEVLAGEDPMLDAGLRVPLVTAGFRRQGFQPFAVEESGWSRSGSTPGTPRRSCGASASGSTASPTRPRSPAGPTRPRHGSGCLDLPAAAGRSVRVGWQACGGWRCDGTT